MHYKGIKRWRPSHAGRWRRSDPYIPTSVLVVVLSALLAFGVSLVFGNLNLLRPTAPFTYSGRLLNDGLLVDDTCDFQFALYDTEYGGQQIAKTQRKTLATSQGVFTTVLDFGRDALTLRRPYLDISVRCPSGSGEYTRMLRRPLMGGVMSFDMAGFRKLADSRLRVEPQEAPPTSVDKELVLSSDNNGTAGDAGFAQGSGDSGSLGAKARDDAPPNNGAKRMALLREDPPGSHTAGEKRSDGTKGLPGVDTYRTEKSTLQKAERRATRASDATSSETDQILGEGGFDLLVGQSVNETVSGDNQDDILLGNAGNDTTGNSGDDELPLDGESGDLVQTGDDLLSGTGPTTNDDPTVLNGGPDGNYTMGDSGDSELPLDGGSGDLVLTGDDLLSGTGPTTSNDDSTGLNGGPDGNYTAGDSGDSELPLDGGSGDLVQTADDPLEGEGPAARAPHLTRNDGVTCRG